MARRRVLNLAGGVICLAMLSYALYAQYALGLEPCPLCIFQRVTIFALAVLFLAAALQNPRGGGRYVYAALVGLAALATIGLATRHLYIQSQPPGTVASCGAPLAVMLQYSPLTEVVRKVLAGGGECSEVNWKFAGLAMPAWVLITALFLGTTGVFANSRQ
ncbi:MAG TPA: disulfide bond formation protein B [Steroidobacteraceae bacterium]|jgi:disulfide bond formation protein DsbB